jgi:hypothetical protein
MNRTIASDFLRAGRRLRVRRSNVWLRWTALAAGLHLFWELAQLPLYTIYRQGDLPALTYAVAHCTAGDALIALVTYLVTATITRSLSWPHTRPWAGLAIAVLAGVAYTAFSEWRNVYRLGYWAYTDAMPLVLGIGLSPLMQWVVVPALIVVGLRLPAVQCSQCRHG